MDDVLSSHLLAEVNDKFAQWVQQKYGGLKDVEVKRGKVFQFLGMTLDFSIPGECHVSQCEHIDDIVNSFPIKFAKSGKLLTPCTSNLYEKGNGGLLSNHDKELFHSLVAK